MATRTDEQIAELSAPADLVCEKRVERLDDVAADLYLETRQYDPAELAAEQRAVRRKIDWILMPMICITYTLQFMDKSTLNYAAAYTFIKDVGLTGQRYSWAAAIFNFGYLVFAIPSNMLIQRLPVAKYTGGMLLVWSVLVCCTAAVKTYPQVLVLRFLLGMFEAGISPAIINIVSIWYTRTEQPLRMCIFLGCSGLATMVGALLAFGLGHYTGDVLKVWQLLFIVIGLMNFVWAWVWLLVMPDSPSNARFLSHKQRVIAVERIASNMMGVKTREFKREQLTEALFDVKIWIISVMGLALGTINGGVSNFGSALITGYGFKGVTATFLQFPSGAIELLVVPACGYVASHIKNVRCLIMMIILLAPLGGLLGIRLDSLEHKWRLVGCSWLQGILGAPIVLTWTLMAANNAGHTKRSVANGIYFVFYAAGNIIGPNIVFARQAPRYFSALTGFCVCYGGVFVLAGSLWAYMAHENKRRDRFMGVDTTVTHGADDEAILDGFRDATDKQNPGFRYVL